MLALLWLVTVSQAAYTATVDKIDFRYLNRQYTLITIDETEAAAASEWSVSDLPAVFSILKYQATLESGSASTIQPVLARVTDPAGAADTQDYLSAQDTAAAHINDSTEVRCYLGAETGGVLYGRSRVDSASDNTVSTEILIVWGPL